MNRGMVLYKDPDWDIEVVLYKKTAYVSILHDPTIDSEEFSPSDADRFAEAMIIAARIARYHNE